MDKTKLLVLVVDDSLDYLEAVSGLLATYPCVGTIEVTHSAVETIARVNLAPVASMPDLVLLDIALPDGNGLEVARSIKAKFSSSEGESGTGGPMIVMVTLYDTPAYRAAAMSAGTDGFLSKVDLGERLQAVISDLFPLICSQADGPGPNDSGGAEGQGQGQAYMQDNCRENGELAHC